HHAVLRQHRQTAVPVASDQRISNRPWARLNGGVVPIRHDFHRYRPPPATAEVVGAVGAVVVGAGGAVVGGAVGAGGVVDAGAAGPLAVVVVVVVEVVVVVSGAVVASAVTTLVSVVVGAAATTIAFAVVSIRVGVVPDVGTVVVIGSTVGGG